MRKIKVVVLLVRQLQHGFTKNAKVSPNLTVTLMSAQTKYATRRVKPALHGACFRAVSAPTLSARVPRRARAAFEKERFHYEHSSCFHGRRLRR